jgi:hypothetical protein
MKNHPLDSSQYLADLNEVASIERDIVPIGRFEPWYQVFKELHADAAARLKPGSRYEIRLVGAPPYRNVMICREASMNQVEPWTDTPEQTADHYRVGRYVTPKE